MSPSSWEHKWRMLLLLDIPWAGIWLLCEQNPILNRPLVRSNKARHYRKRVTKAVQTSPECLAVAGTTSDRETGREVLGEFFLNFLSRNHGSVHFIHLKSLGTWLSFRIIPV